MIGGVTAVISPLCARFWFAVKANRSHSSKNRSRRDRAKARKFRSTKLYNELDFGPLGDCVRRARGHSRRDRRKVERIADDLQPAPGFRPHFARRQNAHDALLATPTAYSYKRDTVTIYGNVVKATHGETRNETLGNGDGSQALQTFTLKQPPLTFVSGAESDGR